MLALLVIGIGLGIGYGIVRSGPDPLPHARATAEAWASVQSQGPLGAEEEAGILLTNAHVVGNARPAARHPRAAAR